MGIQRRFVVNSNILHAPFKKQIVDPAMALGFYGWYGPIQPDQLFVI